MRIYEETSVNHLLIDSLCVLSVKNYFFQHFGELLYVSLYPLSFSKNQNMVRNCSILSCMSTQRREGPSLFSLPQDEKLKEKWYQAIGRSNIAFVKNVYICEHHFTKESIQYTFGMRRIKPGCLPTIFDLPSSHTTAIGSSAPKCGNESALISGPNECTTDDPPQSMKTASAKPKRKFFSGDYNVEDMECAEKAKNFFERVKKEKSESRKRCLRLQNKISKLKKEVSNLKALLKKRKDEKVLGGSAAETGELQQCESLQIALDPNICSFVQNHVSQESSTADESDRIIESSIIKTEPLSDSENITNGIELSESSNDACLSPNFGNLEIVIKQEKEDS